MKRSGDVHGVCKASGYGENHPAIYREMQQIPLNHEQMCWGAENYQRS